MKCSKCGQENEDKARYCDNCGNVLIELGESQIISYAKNESKKANNIVISYAGIVSILGGITSISGSYKMTQIKSVSGNSIDESFYSSFGVFGIGFGLFMIAIGIYIYNKGN